MHDLPAPSFTTTEPYPPAETWVPTTEQSLDRADVAALKAENARLKRKVNYAHIYVYKYSCKYKHMYIHIYILINIYTCIYHIYADKMHVHI